MIEDLYNAEFERSGDFDILDSDEVEHQALADSLINGVPSLKKWKITSAITGASFGKIFKLNNNHILKLFVGGVNPVEDVEWYKKCYNLLHSGGAKATTLPVYEYGQLKINNKFPIWYVEMAEVEPLDKFLKLTGRAVGGDDGDSEGINVVGKLKAYFEQAYNRNITDLEGIKEYVAKQFRIFDTPGLYPKADDDSEEGFDYGGEMYRPLTEAEAFAILEAFVDMIKMGFKLSDVAPRNLGVLKQSSPSNPKIVIFDR